MHEFGSHSEEEAKKIRHEQAELPKAEPLEVDPAADPLELAFIERYKDGLSLGDVYRTALERDRVMIEQYGFRDGRDKRLKRNDELLREVGNISDDAIFAALCRPSLNEDVFAYALEQVGGPENLAKKLQHLVQFTDAGWKASAWPGYSKSLLRYQALAMDIYRERYGSATRYKKSYEVRGEDHLVSTKSHIDEGIISALQKLASEYPETRDICEQTVQDILFEQSGWAFEYPIAGAPAQFDEGLEGLQKEFFVEFHQMAGPVIRDAISALGEIGTEESIPFLKNWMNHQDPEFIGTIARTVQKISPEKGAKEFLPELRSDSRYMRIAARYILQRLEFGRIGMSKNGAQYLDKVYDLGSRNEEGNIVQRVSDRGQLGVFVPDEQGSFQFDGLFDMDWSDERTVQPSVSSLTAETLFVPQRGESADERAEREQIAQEFIQKYMAFSDDRIFQESSTRLNNHSLREQAAFFRCVTRADDATKSRLDTFMKRYESDGLKTFLSLEGGSRHGDRILDLAETLPPDIAAQFIDRYARIVDTVELVMEYSKDVLPDGEEMTLDMAEHVRENLLTKAHALVERLHAELPSATNEAASHERIARELEDANAVLLLFASTFQTLAEEKKIIDLEEFRSIRLDVLSPDKLKAKEKDELVQIAERNYPKEKHQKVIGGLRRALEVPENRLYIVRHNEAAIGFLRFDPQPDGSVYAGSLNIRAGVRGSSFGETILRKAIERESRDHRITAKAHPNLRFASRYIGEYGFVVTKLLENDEGYGETYLDLEINHRRNEHLRHAQEPTEDIVGSYASNEWRTGDHDIILRFAFPEEKDAMLAETKRIFDSGSYVMTAYRRDPADSKMLYLVFEQDPLSEMAQESPEQAESLRKAA